jgi:hypothetical protein
MAKKNKSIRISPEHGVNPSIAVCFFCGKDKGLVMLGKLKGDAKAPKRAIYDYTPCEECAAKMKQGTTVIECVREDNQTLPIQEGAWPTGRWCVMPKEASEKLFKNNSSSVVLLEDKLYEQLVKG